MNELNHEIESLNSSIDDIQEKIGKNMNFKKFSNTTVLSMYPISSFY